ncbi:hypothetical protein [Streptomyces sp. NPDC057582]|uniref:hypothetical protein n=1 Tax=Streptomyces sp. NPDC057582 TaxID=3346174 RepID=UPI0036740598
MNGSSGGSARNRRLDPTVAQRTPARRYRVLRKTVVKALNHPVPPVRKSSPPRVSVLKRVEGFIDEMLLLIPHVVVRLGS